MAGAAVGALVSSAFAGSAAAYAIEGFVATTLFTAGVAGGTSLIVGGLVAGGAGLLAGQITGSLVNAAITGSPDGNTPATAAVSSARAQGVLINGASNVEPLPVIYGTRKVGGSRSFVGVTGNNNEYLHFVIAIAEGEIDAISQIYINDLPITDPRYAGLTYTETYLGTDDQAASAALVAAFPGVWTAQHRGAGVAYAYIRVLYSQNVFNGLPNFTFDVCGKKVYDPRTGLTVYSNTPPLCIRDYMTNARYGRGIPAARIIDSQFITAANHCEEQVAVPGGTQARYTCDGVINVDNTCFDNLKSLVSSCRGMPIYSAGRYGLVIDKAETPGFDFNEDNITGEWAIVQPGRRAKFNRVTASIYNPEANWQPDFAIADSTAFRADDNGLALEAKISLPFTANLYRGQQLAGLFLKQSRFGIVARFTALQVGLKAEVGDVVTITHTTPGWVAKPFRVMHMEIKNDDEVEVTCNEYDATAYDLDALTEITGARSTTLPDVFAVAAPGVPSVVETLYETTGSVGVRAKASITCSAGDSFVRKYLFEYKLSSDSAWRQLPDELSPLSEVNDLAPGIYNFRVRAENAIGSRSAYSGTAIKEILGLTARPSALENLSVIAISGRAHAAWDLSPDLDVRIGGRAVMRHTPLTTGAVWENGIVLDEFNGDAVNGTLPLLTGTYMLKARDSSGNYSADMVAFVATESQVTGFTTVATSTQAPGFAGVKSGVAVDGTVLKLDGTTFIDSMLTSVDDWGFIDGLGGIASAGTYYFDAPMNFGAVLTRRLNAVIQALSVDSGDLIDDRGEVDSWDSVDGDVVNDCDATLYYRTTQTDPTGSPAWGEWTPFMTADVTCWGVQFRLDLVSGAPTHNILISTLTVIARSSP